MTHAELPSWPTLRAPGEWVSLVAEGTRQPLEACLAPYVAGRRWFRSKSRHAEGAKLEASFPLRDRAAEGLLVVVALRFTEGADERYVLPLAFLEGAPAEAVARAQPHLVIARLDVATSSGSRAGYLVDGVADPALLQSLLARVREGSMVKEGDLELRFRGILRTSAWSIPAATPRVVDVEQTNTSVVYGDACMLKIVRRLDDEPGADLEMGEFLTRAGYAHAPPLIGAIELASPGRPASTVAVVHRFVANQGDAWKYFLARLARVLREEELPLASLDDVRLLAGRVGELHLALASGKEPAFVPEPLCKEERARLAEATRGSLEAVLGTLRDSSGADRSASERVLARTPGLHQILRSFEDTPTHAEKTRIHGDLHLGQILRTPDDFVLIDFEGEPARPLHERKSKRSPLADVAGVLRSFHYASVSGLRAQRATPHGNELSETWYRACVHAFLEAYLAVTAPAGLSAAARAEHRAILDYYALEKCVYEVRYELDNRPDWVAIPLAGLEQLARPSDRA